MPPGRGPGSNNCKNEEAHCTDIMPVSQDTTAEALQK
jgi:hypothetical protein